MEINLFGHYIQLNPLVTEELDFTTNFIPCETYKEVRKENIIEVYLNSNPKL